MVRKKETIKPVVAKPLSDTEKRNLVTSFVTNDVKENVTNNVTKNITNNDTKIVADKDTLKVTKDVTDKDTISVTKKVAKDVTITKRILLGKKEIVANFTSNKLSRPNYNLSEDTIEKIEKISDILGYKKAEFLDIYLNGTLTKVLKDLEKNNK